MFNDAELKAAMLEDLAETIECRCTECGGRFDEDLLVKQYYAEYPRASMQPMYISPCCHAEWNYIEAV